MKTNKSVRWFLVGFSLLTFLSFVGVTTGTLAWYAYSTRGTMAYKGVSVYNAEQLQIGIVDNASNPKIKLDTTQLADNSCVRDGDIVWANFGSGLDTTVISAYLSETVTNLDTYYNELTPVTTLDRALNQTGVQPDALTLYKAPMAGANNTTILADTKSYISIPLVFRTIDNNNNYVGGSNIWLRKTEPKVLSTDKTDITKSLRIFTEDPNDLNKRYLINPSDTAQTGSTTVAGLLDLNHDGYYDNSNDDSYSDQKELVYGKYTITPVYGEKSAADSELTNVNDLTTAELGHGASSFYAKHRQDVRTISNYDDIKDGFAKANYYGMGSMAPSLNGSGTFSGGKPVTTTADSGAKLAYLNVTIFLEGWDHCVIDKALDCQFNLGLTFEIDRV